MASFNALLMSSRSMVTSLAVCDRYRFGDEIAKVLGLIPGKSTVVGWAKLPGTADIVFRGRCAILPTRSHRRNLTAWATRRYAVRFPTFRRGAVPALRDRIRRFDAGGARPYHAAPCGARMTIPTGSTRAGRSPAPPPSLGRRTAA